MLSLDHNETMKIPHCEYQALISTRYLFISLRLTKEKIFPLISMTKFFILHIFALGKGYMIDSQKDKQEKKREIRKVNEIT